MNELYHFGIKGQKWGIRRYQNEDGTLTAAGKKRYSDYENGIKSSSETKKAYKRIEKLKKIGASNDSIQKANEDYEKSKSRDIDAHRYTQLKKKYSTERAITQGKTREEAQVIAKRTAADALEKLLR